MEWPSIKAEAGIFFKKYRFVILVLLAGLCLMMIPQGGEEPEEISIPAPQESAEQKLKEILGKDAERIGKVERFAFYERTRSAFAVVVTGESRCYGNIIVKKGVTFA